MLRTECRYEKWLCNIALRCLRNSKLTPHPVRVVTLIAESEIKGGSYRKERKSHVYIRKDSGFLFLSLWKKGEGEIYSPKLSIKRPCPVTFSLMSMSFMAYQMQA